MKECQQCQSCYNDDLTICPNDGSQLRYSLAGNTLLAETYRLDKLIARGSMGSVYRAQQEDLQRPVAVKILNPQLVASNVARERFRREALAAASLKHPNLVTVYDFSSQSGLFYIVMELLEGRTLADYLAVEPRLEINEAIKITLEICDGLSQAHSKGIIHRDLKPSNIFLCNTTSGIVTKIFDFGLVKLKERTLKSITSGALIGSLHYTAPEQFRATEIDVRADIYSLGTIVYQMLTGRPPFNTPNKADLIYQQLNAKPLPPHHIIFDISPMIEAVVMKALEKDPEARYSSIDEFATALKQAPKRNLRRTVGMFMSPLNTGKKATEKEIQQATQQALSFDHFIARKRERAKLRQAFEQASEGRAIALLIVGEHGIGKSQLLNKSIKEFQEAGTLCFFGQFTNTATPVWSLLNFQQYLQKLLLEQEHFEEIFGDLSTSLEEEVTGVAPKMTTAALFQGRAENRAERSLELLAQAFLYLSRKYPLIIALDDLHLADGTSLNFLMHLIGLAAQSPILFLFAARSQDLAISETAAANWLDRISNQRQLQKLTLGALITTDVKSLLDKIFEPNSITDDTVNRLTQATEGNPFYLINLLRLMLEEGQISWDGQQWITGTLTEIKVPESVASLIEARLTFLAPEKRQVLEKATLLGETFGFEALRKFTDFDEDGLLKIIDDCLRYGLLKEVNAPNNSSDDDYYSFTQHLLYQVLYEKWPKNERKQLHKSAGQVLASLCSKHNHHNQAAQQFELAEEFAEAFSHYSIAANLAWRAGEVNLAKNQLKNAQAISEKVPSLTKLLDPNKELTQETQTLATHYCDYLILSVDLKVCDTLAQAEEFMEMAVRLAQRLTEPILLARVLVAAGHFQQSRGDYMGALNYFERALMIYDQTDNKSRYNIILEQIKALRAKLKPQKPTADIFD